MSSSNRFELFSYAEKASRENSPEGSDTDYPRQLLGDELTIEWSPGPSPEPAASDPADPAPATTDPVDVEITGTIGETTTVYLFSAGATPDLSMQGIGESLPAASKE